MAGTETDGPPPKRRRTNEVAYHVKRLMRGEDLDFEVAKECMERLVHQRIHSVDTNFAAFFAAMTTKGPTREEILGCTEAVLEIDGFQPKRRTIDTDEPIYSICGCGKTDFKIFNVSTTAAFIAASMGLTITKQGSYGTSKSTGAADAIELLGVDLTVDEETMVESAEEDSIAFFTIGDKIRNYDNIYGGNFYFYHPLSFGFSALINKVNVDGVVYGTMSRDTELVASVLQEYGFDDTMVVNCEILPDRYNDELSIFGESRYSVVRGDEVHTETTSFEHLSPHDDPAAVASRPARENAKTLLSVLLGREGPEADMACLNTGALLFAAGEADSIEAGYHAAKEVQATGRAYETLRSLVENTGGDLASLRALREECSETTDSHA